MLRKVPNHPVLTFFLNVFSVAAVFGGVFGCYGLAEIFLLKPDNLNIEAATSFTIICFVTFVIAYPISKAILKKAKMVVVEDISRGNISKRVY